MSNYSKPTPIQYLIEFVVTNGLGFRDLESARFENLTDEENLRKHLEEMPLGTSLNRSLLKQEGFPKEVYFRGLEEKSISKR